MAQQRDGATTVAGTMIAAHWAGIQVFATGGIGGVHRGQPFDVSADLPELAQTPVVDVLVVLPPEHADMLRARTAPEATAIIRFCFIWFAPSHSLCR